MQKAFLMTENSVETPLILPGVHRDAEIRFSYTEPFILILTRTRRPLNNRVKVGLVKMNKEESLFKKTCLSGEFNQKDVFNADAVISLM